MTLIEKMRAARERRVEAGGFKFTVRRPTDVEMLELQGEGSVSRLFPFVVGWEGVKEIDLIAGGDPVPVPFDSALFAEWVSDRPDILGPIVSEVMESYRKHSEALEDLRKN